MHSTHLCFFLWILVALVPAMSGAQVASNDDCATAVLVVEGVFSFDTVGASTDGPDEPAACTFFGDSQVQSDVWYCYTASCAGIATVSLCGSAYDTKLAVYSGCACPPVGGPLACNDDACGTSSEVSFVVQQGQSYLVRVGGYNGSVGAGTLTITCGAVTCPPLTGLSCNVAGSDVLLSWATGGYASISVYRDGAGLLAVLPGTAAVFVESGLAPGHHQYTVEAHCSAGTMAAEDCVAFVVPPSVPFQRADCNVDGSVQLADAVFLLSALFPNLPALPVLPCEDAGDCNDDGALSIADAICVLVHLFGSSPQTPPAPYLVCGSDPTPDLLSCTSFAACP